ncbi:TPA: hypothetical protein ACKPFN_003672 [Pseudomonas aeruginosa]
MLVTTVTAVEITVESGNDVARPAAVTSGTQIARATPENCQPKRFRLPGVSADAGSYPADLFLVEAGGETFVCVDLHALSSVIPRRTGLGG